MRLLFRATAQEDGLLDVAAKIGRGTNQSDNLAIGFRTDEAGRPANDEIVRVTGFQINDQPAVVHRNDLHWHTESAFLAG